MSAQCCLYLKLKETGDYAMIFYSYFGFPKTFVAFKRKHYTTRKELNGINSAKTTINESLSRNIASMVNHYGLNQAK